MKLNKKTVIIILTCAIFTVLAGQSVRAEETYRATGTLKMEYMYHDEDQDIPVDGAEISVTRVAEISAIGENNISFNILDAYQGTGITIPSGMTAAQSDEYAQTFSKYRVQNNLSEDKSAVSDQSGWVNFGEIPSGLYLVEQKGASGSAVDYDSMRPMLIMLPAYDVDGGWQYNVTIYPKTELKKTTPTETPTNPQKPETPNKTKTKTSKSSSVKTGDDANMFLWGGILVISLSFVMILLRASRRNEEDDLY